MAKVSLNLVVGFYPKSHHESEKKKIREQVVVILVYSEATHNFIFNRVVDQLGFKLDDNGGFSVIKGAERVEKSKGISIRLVVGDSDDRRLSSPKLGENISDFKDEMTANDRREQS